MVHNLTHLLDRFGTCPLGDLLPETSLMDPKLLVDKVEDLVVLGIGNWLHKAKIPAALSDYQWKEIAARVREGGKRCEGLYSNPKAVKAEFLCRHMKDLVVEFLLSLPDQKKQGVIGHFYEIRKDGSVKGYLLGTVHAIDGTILPLNKTMLEALASSERLFLEVKELDMLMSHELKSINQAIETFDEEKIELGIDNYFRVFEQYAPPGGDFSELKEMRKFLDSKEILKICVEQYLFLIALQTGALDSSDKIIHGLDEWIFQQFTQNKEKVFGLESFEEHLLYLKQQKRDIKDMERILNPSLEAEIDQISILSKYWKEGGMPKEYDKTEMHEKRCEDFAEKICSDLSKNQTCGFYAFSLSHLYDCKGVIGEMERRGYQITRAYP